MTKLGRGNNDTALEHGLWFLLLLVSIVQIACAINAGGDMRDSHSPTAAVQQHGDSMLAKK